ncbi:hypothetical protein CBOM_05013 [Ceraceosorus bombacis]|uniref:Uncharacterized protein n=1 Tax=Ceraceosorus bombacis TaxID=401625 RepID=A0A0P1BJC6_9BASI|nr:hypothetical protein CBOM_05013 [Ceraceosorus bombacis]
MISNCSSARRSHLHRPAMHPDLSKSVFVAHRHSRSDRDWRRARWIDDAGKPRSPSVGVRVRAPHLSPSCITSAHQSCKGWPALSICNDSVKLGSGIQVRTG